VIVQACLNGGRDRAFHPAVPATLDAIVADAVATVKAGAAELHVHVRDDSGGETLHPDAVDRTVTALRRACPGTLIGISTGEWIERDDARRRRHIAAWSVLPDYASVNLVEGDCAAVIAALRARGVGVEAGLWTAADAERCLALDLARPALRYLLEINHQGEAEALAELRALEAVLLRAPGKPILLHGLDATMWPLLDLAFARGYSTRIGLEDGRELPDGRVAPSNAALVKAALERRASVARSAPGRIA
jgi:uncharacterized protein (DUF849 family)